MQRDGQTELLVELLDAEPRLRINREIALLTQQSVGRNISRQLAHEIRNPLGGLRGAAQLLQRQLDSPELQQYTQVIIEEADRLAGLVDSMLGPHRAGQQTAGQPPPACPSGVRAVAERGGSRKSTSSKTTIRACRS